MILCANTRSAVQKLEIISSFLTKLSVDCFIATETWFSDVHSDDFASIPGYQLFRDDRKGRVGGGVAIWAKPYLSPQRIDVLNKPPSIEFVAIYIHPKICLIGIYIPPSVAVSSKQLFTDFLTDTFDDILNTFPDSRFVLCGDLNHFHISDLCNNVNLVNTFVGITYGKTQLDYILMSEDLSPLYDVTTELPVENSKVAHKSLLASPRNQTIVKDTKIWRNVYDLRKSNIEAFIDHLTSVDWTPVYDKSKDVHFKCDFFHSVIYEGFITRIPSTKVSFTNNDKPWMTPVVKRLINARWKAFRERDFDKFTHYKEKVKSEIVRAKRNWVKKEKSCNIWKMVNTTSGKQRNTHISHLLQQLGGIGEAVEVINQAFVKNFQLSEDIFVPKNKDEEELNIHVQVYEVFNFMNRLKPRKSSPDIPTILYKEASHLLAEPLATIFNQSLSDGVIPSRWKRTAVVPVPKCPRPCLNDLRQISLLPVTFKILERFVLKFLQDKLLHGYGAHQYGFRPKSSTACANIALHDFYTKTLEEPDVLGVQIITYDFAKAFDKLKFNIIITRLIQCKIPAKLLAWFQDYLRDRQQFVRIGLTESQPLPITSGVPQGSILGPYLFSVVTGLFDVSHLPCKVTIYADDFTLCVPVFRNQNNSHVLKVHNIVCNWSQTIGLPLNIKKCKMLCISRKKIFEPIQIDSVPIVNELKILGVTFDRKCNWNAHVNNVLRGASRRLFLIRMIKQYVKKDDLITIFNGLVRSILEYSSPLFIGLSKENSDKLERVLRRFHRFLCGDCYKLCDHHNLDSLALRRKRAALKLFQQAYTKSHILHTLIPRVSHSGRVILPVSRTNTRLNSFFVKMSQIINENFIRK